jgi:hypothetical protein
MHIHEYPFKVLTPIESEKTTKNAMVMAILMAKLNKT